MQIQDHAERDLVPFERVYEEYSGRVFRYCMALVGDPAVAEDLAADTFVAAYRAYERTSPDADGMKPWLFRIAHNLAMNHLRRRQVWRRVWTQLARGPVAADDAERIAIDNEEIREMVRAMSGLRERERQLIGLRYVAGLSLREVGAVLHMRETTVAMAAGRALERLRRQLDRAAQ